MKFVTLVENPTC